MEEKEMNEEEILDENISETTEDVDSLLKSSPQKFNKKDEDQEDTLVNKQDEGEEFKATWPLHDDMKKTLTNDFHRGCRIKADKYEFASNVLPTNDIKRDTAQMSVYSVGTTYLCFNVSLMFIIFIVNCSKSDSFIVYVLILCHIVTRYLFWI